MKQTFTKAERLTSRKVIDQLFKKGSTEVRTFYLFPFRALYLPGLPQTESVPPEVPIGPPVLPTLPAILITVSKRNFKRAVDRNLLRRRIREAYRKNKSLLFDVSGLPRPAPAYITFIYTVKTEISFEEIEKGMKLALTKIGASNGQ